MEKIRKPSDIILKRSTRYSGEPVMVEGDSGELVSIDEQVKRDRLRTRMSRGDGVEWRSKYNTTLGTKDLQKDLRDAYNESFGDLKVNFVVDGGLEPITILQEDAKITNFLTQVAIGYTADSDAVDIETYVDERPEEFENMRILVDIITNKQLGRYVYVGGLASFDAVSLKILIPDTILVANENGKPVFPMLELRKRICKFVDTFNKTQYKDNIYKGFIIDPEYKDFLGIGNYEDYKHQMSESEFKEYLATNVVERFKKQILSVEVFHDSIEAYSHWLSFPLIIVREDIDWVAAWTSLS